MRALSDIVESPLPHRTVFSSADAGEYAATLGPGLYLARIAGGGAGAAASGYMSSSDSAEAQGMWCYGCGSGGGYVRVTFRLRASATASIVVGAGGAASTDLADEPPPSGQGKSAYSTAGGYTTLTCGEDVYVKVSGAANSRALITPPGMSTQGAPGVGGYLSQGSGIAVVEQATGGIGDATGSTAVATIEADTQYAASGGSAGQDAVLGNAGRGGSVEYAYTSGGTVQFSVGGGADGAVVIERIG